MVRQDSDLITALLGRIIEKLPVSSGLAITSLETDAAFVQSIARIYDLSAMRMPEIIIGLLAALDAISKVRVLSLLFCILLAE